MLIAGLTQLLGVSLANIGTEHRGIHQIIEVVYHFLRYQEYPSGFLKHQKRVLRRKSQENFCVKKGLLYSAVSRCRKRNDVKREWRQVPRTQQDINRILHSCHDSLEGTSVLYIIIILFA